MAKDTAAAFTGTKEDGPYIPWPRVVHAAAWGSFLVMTAATIVAYAAFRDTNVWEGWTPARELNDPDYAETIYRDSIFRTRANTWSNLAYVLAGCYPVVLTFYDWRRKVPPNAGHLVRTPVFSALYGLACVYLGFGSGLFHASLTRLGQQLDVAAMYAPLVVLIGLNISRWIPRIPGTKTPTWPLVSVLTVVAAILLFAYKWSMSSSVVLPSLILAVMAFVILDPLRRDKHAARWLIVAFGLFVVAFVCRQLDVAGKFSGPDAWYQGHALWHVFSAASLLCTYAYYRTERLIMEDSRPRRSPK